MKNTIAMLCLAASAISLSACVGTTNQDTAPPYGISRTATHSDVEAVYVAPIKRDVYVAPAERVFQRAQAK